MLRIKWKWENAAKILYLVIFFNVWQITILVPELRNESCKTQEVMY